jgi:hypothetical protein
LYRLRYGRHLPDDDAGRDDLELAFNQIARTDACIEWAAKWAPWMASDEAAALAEQIAMDPQWLKARPLGERLGLTDSERTRLDIRTIRPIDLTDEAFVGRNRQKERERKAWERQRARAAKSAPASQTKPWEAEGINRATWYRHRQKAKSATQKRATKSVRNNLVSITADGISRTKPPAKAVGTPQKSIGSRVEGEALVGNSSQQSRSFKTRFPSAMRLNKEMRAFAVEAGFTPDKIQRTYEMYRDVNIAQRTYSIDWTECWFTWVNREATIVNARYARDRARAYWEPRS